MSQALGRPRLRAIRSRVTRCERAEESGFPTKDTAVERLAQRPGVHRTTGEQREPLGEMAFEVCVKARFARRRGLTGGTESRDRALGTHRQPDPTPCGKHSDDVFSDGAASHGSAMPGARRVGREPA